MITILQKYIFIILLFQSLIVYSQDNKRIEYANTITKEDLSKYLHIIASDKFEGRKTGELGQKRAAKYISDHFGKIKLTAPYSKGETPFYQRFPLWRASWGETYIKAKGKTNIGFQHFYPLKPFNLPKTNLKLVFAGFGEEADLEKLEVKDKAVLVTEKLGISAQTISKTLKNKGAKLLIIAHKRENKFKTKVEAFQAKKSKSLKYDKNKFEDFGVLYTSPKVAASLLGINFNEYKQKIIKGKNHHLAGQYHSKIKVKIEIINKKVITENVLGYVEGTDKKDEVVVMTAHYDHIGITNGAINNGADDDGSGTVAIMELAQAFAKAKAEGNGPRRTILFMTVTGEEIGLYGSKYYSENPYFPLKNTVVDLNMDMIGRIDAKHKGNPNYIYVIGSDMLSSDLHKVNEQIATKYAPKIQLDYTYNSADDPNRFYYRSDHYNFAKHNIPVIFYFNGTHKDYHKPTDTVDKIHFGKIEKITRLMFHVAWEIANRDERLKVDKATN